MEAVLAHGSSPPSGRHHWAVVMGCATLAFIAGVLNAADGAAAPVGTPSGHVLLQGSLGTLVTVPTNAVPPALLPPPAIGLSRQLPQPARGTTTPDAVQDRLLRAQRQRPQGLEWFPATQPPLGSYLAAQDEFGNTAIKPGALVPLTPVDVAVQQGKYWLSEIGLRYSLAQTFTWASLSGAMQGADNLGLYTFDFAAKWAVFDASTAGTAGWVSTQIEAKSGLGAAGDTQSPQANLGTVTAPAQIWSEVNGVRLPELAWQQSFRDGEWVALVGVVSQGNYLDANSYANSGSSQFLNSALVNSMVLPLPDHNFGLNLQWQPAKEWYALLGVTAGDAPAGSVPWTGFSWDQWSVVGEVGYAPGDWLGLGPGVFRVQPFVAQAGGPVQGGFGVNFQQQLGRHSPFGWFGRFGVGGSQVAAGASTQVGTGFAMKGPIERVGLWKTRGNDVAGVGFVWSQPSATSQPVIHENEFVLEAGYILQLTPTARIQPDVQLVWNPAFNPEPTALVFQLQLELAW